MGRVEVMEAAGVHPTFQDSNLHCMGAALLQADAMQSAGTNVDPEGV